MDNVILPRLYCFPWKGIAIIVDRPVYFTENIKNRFEIERDILLLQI